MPHMVIYRSADGKPGYHQAEALDEAVRFVEHLRNGEGINESRIFAMTEVPIEFKTYYRVEVAAAGDSAAPAAPAAPAPAPAPASGPAAEAPAAAAPAAAAAAPAAGAAAAPAGPAVEANKGEPAMAGANGGRFGLFGKG